MNVSAKKNLTLAALAALLAVPALGTTANSNNIHIPKLSNILMTKAHADSHTVSLPSQYVGTWRANYTYGPETAGHQRSYDPVTVKLGRNDGYYNRYQKGGNDYDSINYTHHSNGNYSAWPGGLSKHAQWDTFRMLPNGDLMWNEDVSTWHLHKVVHHHTPSPSPTPTPNPKPSPRPSNNNSGNVTPTPSANSGNNITPTDSINNNTQSTLDGKSNTSNTMLGSTNGENNTNVASTKLPQTNEKDNAATAMALGAATLTASASLMALDFSKRHKYEAMENTDARHSSNSNNHIYNAIMSNTFANISKDLK